MYAKEVLWTLTSYDVHRRLVVERKWSADRYEQWLADSLVLTLIEGVKKPHDDDGRRVARRAQKCARS